jgi:tetratricopeptide (TPR) repeat protein
MNSEKAPTQRVRSWSEATVSLFKAIASQFRILVRRLLLYAVLVVRWLFKPTLQKAINLVAAIILLGVVAVALGLILRFLSPKEIIQISAFEIISFDSTSSTQGGKALADLVVDDLHRMLEVANQFTGSNASRKTYSHLRDLPEIPVDTTYGIEIKGISLDVLVATWKHLRYREFRISGDLIIVEKENRRLTLRYETEGRANNFDVTSTAADIEKNLQHLALQILGEINTEAAARYLLQQYVTCTNTLDCRTFYKDALTFCHDWMQKAPNNAYAVYYLGFMLARSTHEEDALPFLERSIALGNPLFLPMNTKGVVLLHQGKLTEAREIFKYVLQKRKIPTVMLNLGNVEERLGNYDEAQSWYSEALKTDSEYVGASLALGQLLSIRASYQEAARVYRKALELEPRRKGILYGLAFALARDGRFEEALRECNQAWRLSPDGEARIDKAMVLIWMNRPAEAVGLLESFVAEKSDNYDAQYQLSLAYLENGDLKSAEARASAMMNQWREIAGLHYLMGKILEAKGDEAGSKSYLDKVGLLDPGYLFTSFNVPEISFVLSKMPKH